MKKVAVIGSGGATTLVKALQEACGVIDRAHIEINTPEDEKLMQYKINGRLFGYFIDKVERSEVSSDYFKAQDEQHYDWRE